MLQIVSVISGNSRCQKKISKARTLLYYEGEVPERVYLLLKGVVRYLKYGDDGSCVTLYRISADEGVWLDTAALERSAQASVWVEEEAEFFTLAKAEAESLRSVKGWTAFMLAQQQRKAGLMAATIEAISFGTLETRLLAWLEQKRGNLLEMTHQEIAQLHGTSREVISRLLKRLEAQGRVRLGRGVVERTRV